ncbi:retrovirus-related pol polyprotein from transposon TNT 1-94 [Tanacetum coccineum]
MAPSQQTTVAHNQNVANPVNDSLYIANSDHPGMVLTNTPFNGSNFLGWSRNVKMALGAKLKLRFIDGSYNKPNAFLYAQSACDLWKEIAERYGQSNGPLIYQLEMELSQITQGVSYGKRDNKNTRSDLRNEMKRLCTYCNQEGHTVDQCFKKIGYPDWYKGKKAKKNTKIDAHVNSGFDEHFHGETPFDMGCENEVGFGQNRGVD